MKVQFHWDRYGKKDENSSCWIRVSHPWAGKGWGAVSTPRIGQEVIVDFLEGDPDQPIITGRVYNAEQPAAVRVPGGRGAERHQVADAQGRPGINELSMDDTAGKEQVFIHGQYNMDTAVEHDETTLDRARPRRRRSTTTRRRHIKHDRTETVDNDETITVHGNRTETVDKDETITIHGNREHHASSKSETRDRARCSGRTRSAINETITVGAAQEITVGGAAGDHGRRGSDRSASGPLRRSASARARRSTPARNQATNVGGDQNVSIGKNASMTIGAR